MMQSTKSIMSPVPSRSSEREIDGGPARCNRAGPPCSTYLVEKGIGSEIAVSAPSTVATARRLPFAIGLATVME
jgi:hypothetical protein